MSTIAQRVYITVKPYFFKASSLFPLSRIIISCNNGFSSLNRARSMAGPDYVIKHSTWTWCARTALKETISLKNLQLDQKPGSDRE